MSKSLAIPCTTLNQFPVDRRIMQNVLKCVVTVASFLLLRMMPVSSECPECCTCRSGTFRCRNASLKSVPSNLCNDTINIDMSFNSISTLNNNIFDNMPLLKTIFVSDNDIKGVDPDVFNQLQDLRQIDLHNNNIDYIHPSLFQYNHKLSILDLSCNKIIRLRLDFNSNTELKFFNLSFNNLTFEDLTNFLPVPSLQVLDISYNQIETISGKVFGEMVNLTHLNISGNPELEYDCNLRTLLTLCLEQNISCGTDDEQSFRMVDNLYCETEELPKAMSLTQDTDEMLNTSAGTTEDGVDEGSGVDGNTGISDNRSSEFNSTEEVLIEPTITSNDDWTLIVIIVSSVCCVVIVITVAVIIIRNRRNSREETSGNLSRTNSIDYLNQEDQFNRRYKNPRNNNIKLRNHYDRVIPSELSRNVLQFQVGDTVAAEVVRVPSFKTRGVATPLNLPEEISPEETKLTVPNRRIVPHQPQINSLSRSNAASVNEHNETVRSGSIKKAKHLEVIR
ncbi:Leucine-rich repeat transmembrane neuronal protein 3 [Zootermopsis nevadensis]|uniref:Leucine-rich repeat transmembrane neuronal protein 3 n=2 Tax=Zootermopsis nevadensis TaxID=136037 RepID=A0A067R390_ZOONE|nr:Leucine-rich repeat transmembrane neuronal protein 3 [Zootermopsis nevadensis]